jgi:hypothetical protein
MEDERARFVPTIPDTRRDDIPGCLLEALVIAHHDERVLDSQEAFDRAARAVGFRARLMPHRNALRRRAGGSAESREGLRTPGAVTG